MNARCGYAQGFLVPTWAAGATITAVGYHEGPSGLWVVTIHHRPRAALSPD